MCDLPLRSTAGLEVGMTVSIHDDRTHGGFYETFATITRVDEDWVGLDHGIEAEYSPSEEPCLTTVYPLDIGHGILRRRFDDNTGNGLHPGAGSTNALLRGVSDRATRAASSSASAPITSRCAVAPSPETAAAFRSALATATTTSTRVRWRTTAARVC